MLTDQVEASAGAPRDQAALSFRLARPEEDDMLSRILCNAFLPLWNHNWFHNALEPLEPVAIGTITSTPPMTNLQRDRVRFYRALISITRLIGGVVTVVDVSPSSLGKDESTSSDIGAIILWNPPHKRLGSLDVITVYRSGFLRLILPWHYGFTGLNRIEYVYEENVRKMWARTLSSLPPNGFRESECGFVQMLAANPKFAGKGYASALLKHQMAEHFAEFPERPVLLDTTTLQGIRAYERLGFRLLAETPVVTGTDKYGMKLKKPEGEEARKETREMCVQRVMVKMPAGSS